MNRQPDELEQTIDVIVVTYQSQDWIDACLDSVPERVGGRPVRKIVVDSASTDSTVPQVGLRVDCELIVLPENRGFAYAVNRAMAASRGVHALLLNPDAMLGVEALERLVARLDGDPRLAAVAPEVVDQRGALQSVAQARPTLAGEFARTFAPLARPFGFKRPDELAEDDPPGWLSGACLLISRAAWRRVGPFDAGYFLYFEETDWCGRALAKGYSLAVVRDSLAVHVGGASSEGASARTRANALFEASRRRYFQRTYGPFTALCVQALHRLRRWIDARVLKQEAA